MLLTVHLLRQCSKVAHHLSQYTPSERTILVEIFAGTGGNTIAFARSNRWARIIAVEKDPKAILCARHNAAIHGVERQIEWREGDCFDVLKSLPREVQSRCVVFASPPWGGELEVSLTMSRSAPIDHQAGPGYSSDAIFSLHTMQPYSLRKVYTLMKDVSELMVLYLPRTSDLRQLAALVPESRKARVTHYCMDGASKVCGASSASNFNVSEWLIFDASRQYVCIMGLLKSIAAFGDVDSLLGVVNRCD